MCGSVQHPTSSFLFKVPTRSWLGGNLLLRSTEFTTVRGFVKVELFRASTLVAGVALGSTVYSQELFSSYLFNF
jgi:hypothetical protein